MPSSFNYMSWNIQNLSDRNFQKRVWDSLEVKYWIAEIIIAMEADIVGVMEVVLSTGEEACKIIAENLEELSIMKRMPTYEWSYVVSSESISSKSGQKRSRKADKYCIFSRKDKVNFVQNPIIYDITAINPKYNNRSPVYWVIGSNSDTRSQINCLLWHAPAPDQLTSKVKATAAIQNIADVYEHIVNNSRIKREKALLSGDFNYDTSKTGVYKPLTSLKFLGFFDGQKTTLTNLKKATLKYINSNKDKFIGGDYNEILLASAYDNIFLRMLSATVLSKKFYIPNAVLEYYNNGEDIDPKSVPSIEIQNSLKQARVISDHLPLVITINSSPKNLTEWVIGD